MMPPSNSPAATSSPNDSGPSGVGSWSYLPSPGENEKKEGRERDFSLLDGANHFQI